jgi:hypothetical protein
MVPVNSGELAAHELVAPENRVVVSVPGYPVEF